MTAFHDVRFPVSLGFGATGGPERSNEIVTLTSGREKRNQRLAHARRRYDAGTGMRSLEDLQLLAAFFEARRGSLHAFRFRDPFDWSSAAPGQLPGVLDQQIGTGDGARTEFKLCKAYGEGPDAYLRPITKPVAGSVRVAIDGEEISAEAFSLDTLTGEVTLTPPPPVGAAVTAGFEFDVAVRFDTEQLVLSLHAFEAGQVPSVPLLEVL